jgi:hypothetical protein
VLLRIALIRCSCRCGMSLGRLWPAATIPTTMRHSYLAGIDDPVGCIFLLGYAASARCVCS